MFWMYEKTLEYPRLVAVSVLSIGVSLGLVFEALFSSGMFGRFGSVTVALGLLTFGNAARELLNRAQDGYFASGSDDVGGIHSKNNIRRAMFWQTIVVTLGTVQWGFGDMLELRFSDAV